MVEDWSTFTTLAQSTQPVLGVGQIPLTPILSFTNDTSATAAGLSNGDVYIETGVFPIRLHTLGGGGGGGITKLTGTTTQTPGTLTDGATALVGTFTLTGAVLGDPIYAGATPALPTGVQVVAKVSSANTVNVEVWNFSGGPQTIPSTVFNVVILH